PPRPPAPPLFPYTTLFRSRAMVAATRIPAVRVPLGGTPRWLPLGTVAEKQAALRAVARELQSLPPGRREALLARLAADLRVEGRSEEHTSELQSRFDLVCR